MCTARLPVVDWTDASRRFKWTRPFGRKTKSGFCACVITFQTQSTSHQDIVGDWKHSSTISYSQQEMEVSGHHHTTVYLPQWKETRYAKHRPALHALTQLLQCNSLPVTIHSDFLLNNNNRLMFVIWTQRFFGGTKWWFKYYLYEFKKKGKVHLFTGTEVLYRPYGP